MACACTVRTYLFPASFRIDAVVVEQRNTTARPFVFIVILVIFSSMLLGWKREKIEKWLPWYAGEGPCRVIFKRQKIYEKEFKCCFGMGGRAINAEDVFVKDVEGL